METRGGSKISGLLRMKGLSRLEVRNEITKAILELNPELTPGINLKFLESKKRNTDNGSWVEYNVLLEIQKREETARYLSFAFENLSNLVKSLSDLNIESIGIDEMDCGESDYYYVLIYILSDGQDQKTENYFLEGGGEEL